MTTPSHWEEDPIFVLGAFAIPVEEIGYADPSYAGPLGRVDWSAVDMEDVRALQAFFATTVFANGEPDSLELFGGQDARHNIYEASKTIAEYIRDENISDTIYIDTSARPMRVGVSEYERLLHPGKPISHAHFLSPDVLTMPADARMPLLRGMAMGFAARLLEHNLCESSSSLLERKDKPILLVDTCVHTGETLYYTKAALERIGFTDVRTMTFSDDKDAKAKIRSDTSAIKDLQDEVCKPFGPEFGVQLSEFSIYARPTHDFVGRTISREMRAEIKQIVREAFATEHDK